MNQDCAKFKTRLSAFLEAQPLDSNHASSPDVYEPLISSIAWNRHLLACLECRRLLNSEQALDELLAGMPNPALSAERQRNLRQRLSVDLRLERLLSISDPYTGAPDGALERIHEGLHEFVAAQSGELTGGLDRGLAHIDSISAPEGLAERIMARVSRESVGEEVLVPQVQPAPKVGGPAQRKPRTGQKIAFQRWFSAGLVAASLAAILWTLPNWFADNNSLVQPDNVAEIAQPDMTPDEQEAIDGDDAELLAMLDRLEVIDLVDELDSEEWELLDDYDRFAIFLMDSGVSNEELDGQGGPR